MIRHFNYYLTGAGWAEARFVSDSQEISFEVSYLSDPLFELCTGLASLSDGSKTELDIVFADEPGEHCLYLRKIDNFLLTEIYWSDEWSLLQGEQRLPTDTQPIYREEGTIQNFSTVVFEGIRDLLN
ncbi:hypothetical protein LZZ85_05465 [Terrimonas sp. NA20]|uniref:YopX protein domain-containing protein n=1 Tax=Terrimonas ginsenosidimutans TaxID=2908004 RepID=A0ABS9KN08_9BACT|nr:hypothetical protein [Terrimonas ginsenosidimutans]MCG2613715.1 hypothetical protein [Terrimonas ginsenosidimutans]